MFQLTDKELENWKSQFATSNREIMGLRKMPYAFTEEGIYMLATVLNSKVAVQTNIAIIRTFKKLREFSKQYIELKKALDELIASSELADAKVMGFLK